LVDVSGQGLQFGHVYSHDADTLLLAELKEAGCADAPYVFLVEKRASGITERHERGEGGWSLDLRGPTASGAY